ncbi:MAG: hypothetical protein JXN59_00180 [Anaerolineae bacterium]|nr:hypothetical protein [Anaerolineae bacterium]
MRKGIGWIILKVFAIAAMGLTAAMNLVGGAGTVCAAFLTQNFPEMAVLLPYQWLYQPLMVLTILIGIAGAWLTFRLVRGGEHAYRNTLLALSAGTLLAGVHFVASLSIRGKAVPANVKFYINLFTLALFLFLLLPALRQHVRFDRPSGHNSRAASGGAAAIVAGLVVLTTPLWAGPSHLHAAGSWIDGAGSYLQLGGIMLISAGLLALSRGVKRISVTRTFSPAPEMEACHETV